MTKKSTEKEIQDVMAEEKSRGKRKIDREARTLHKQFQKDFFQLVRDGDMRKFKSFLNAHGLREGDERYRLVMKLWTDYQKQRKKSFSNPS